MFDCRCCGYIECGKERVTRGGANPWICCTSQLNPLQLDHVMIDLSEGIKRQCGLALFPLAARVLRIHCSAFSLIFIRVYSSFCLNPK